MPEATPPPAGAEAAPTPLDHATEPHATATFIRLIETTIESTLKRLMASPAESGHADMNVSQSKGTELKLSDQLKARDLRAALLLGKIPEGAGLLIDKKTLAYLLQVSQRHVARLVDVKGIPEPVRLGQAIPWRMTEILEWIEDGCPTLRAWSTSRRVSAKTKGK